MIRRPTTSTVVVLALLLATLAGCGAPAWNSDWQRIAFVRMSSEGCSDVITTERTSREVQRVTTNQPAQGHNRARSMVA